MGYKVFNAAGEHVAGDAVLDEVVKAAAMLVDGWVEDVTGEVVYSSPGHRARKRDEDERDEPESLTGVVTPPEEE